MTSRGLQKGVALSGWDRIGGQAGNADLSCHSMLGSERRDPPVQGSATFKAQETPLKAWGREGFPSVQFLSKRC